MADKRQQCVLPMLIALALSAGVSHGQTEPAVAESPRSGDVPVAESSSPPVTTDAAVSSEPQPSEPRELTATVTGMEGMVQYRTSDEEEWNPVRVGMEVTQGVEFRTGPRSAVRLVIPPDQTITLDRLGTMKLIEAIRAGTKVKTDVGMKYGRTRYQIEAAGLEHESKIASPNSTLAVRGTETTVFDQPPYAPEAIVLTGRVDYKRANRGSIAFGGKGRRSAVSAEARDPADEALRGTFVDAGFANARTLAEREILLVQSRAPFVVRNQITAVSALLDFISTADFTSTIDAPTNRTREAPGALSFDLVWDGPADLDLSITTPRSERLSAFPFVPSRDGLIANSATNNVPSGGRIEFDDQGPNEPGAPLNGGRETAYWLNAYPSGKYVARVSYIESAVGQIPMPASYTLTIRDVNTGEPRVITGTVNPGDKPVAIPVLIPKR